MMKRAKSPSSGQKTASACEATRTTQPFAQRQKPNVAPTFRRISGYSCGVFFQRAPMPRCADGRGSLLGAQASSPGLRPCRLVRLLLIQCNDAVHRMCSAPRFSAIRQPLCSKASQRLSSVGKTPFFSNHHTGLRMARRRGASMSSPRSRKTVRVEVTSAVVYITFTLYVRIDVR